MKMLLIVTVRDATHQLENSRNSIRDNICDETLVTDNMMLNVVVCVRLTKTLRHRLHLPA